MSSPSVPEAHDRVGGDRDVDGVALVGARRGRPAADQEVGDDVVVGDVPAHRDVRLVQRDRPAGVGQGDPAEADHDVSLAREQVDALEGVVRVADDRVGLLDPVERCPLDDDPAAEVGVVRCEPRGRDDLRSPTATSKLRPGVWCQLEVHRAEHRGESVGHLGCCARHEGGRDVGDRHGVHRHHPARLPHQHGIRGVEHGHAVERGAHPPGHRFVPQLARAGRIRCSPRCIAISRCCASRLPRSTPVRRAEHAAGRETLST